MQTQELMRIASGGLASASPPATQAGAGAKEGASGVKAAAAGETDMETQEQA